MEMINPGGSQAAAALHGREEEGNYLSAPRHSETAAWATAKKIITNSQNSLYLTKHQLNKYTKMLLDKLLSEMKWNTGELHYFN